MTKLALILVAFLTFGMTSAFAGGDRYDLNVNLAPPVYPSAPGGRYIQGYAPPRAGAVCAPGLKPTSLGCMGETITDREKLQEFDRTIHHGCVEGEHRTNWVEGTDNDGRPVKYAIHQTAHCNRNAGS